MYADKSKATNPNGQFSTVQLAFVDHFLFFFFYIHLCSIFFPPSFRNMLLFESINSTIQRKLICLLPLARNAYISVWVILLIVRFLFQTVSFLFNVVIIKTREALENSRKRFFFFFFITYWTSHVPKAPYHSLVRCSVSNWTENW